MEPSGDDRLKVVNATNHKLSVYYGLDSLPEYPAVNGTEIYLDRLIEIGDTSSIVVYNLKPWPDFIEKSNNKKLNLFVYNVDSLLIYKNIDTLIKRKIYKTLSYSSEEINSLNWIVVVKDK
ncbi:hypothetical protein D3C80_1430630 [compost metagenome]